MSGMIRIQGADRYANNSSGGNYLPQLLASTGQRSKLHKVVVSNLGTAGDVYLWVFDNAIAGLGTGAGPRMVLLCPNGVCSTLDLTDGTPFVSGIYLALATANPTTAGTTMTLAPTNAAIIDASYRLE